MPIIIDCIQGTPEWHKARNGLITASLFEMVVACKKQGQETQKYHSVMMKLAGERITGKIVEERTTLAMQRGIDLEPSARQIYGTITHTEPECIGFVLADDRLKGFSPDAFIGTNGLLEIKTKKPEILIPHFYQKGFPDEHKAQCQGGLWIAQREWVDLMLYWPDMPPLIKRAYRDEAYIRMLENKISRFNEALERMVYQIKHANTEIGEKMGTVLRARTAMMECEDIGCTRRAGITMMRRERTMLSKRERKNLEERTGTQFGRRTQVRLTKKIKKLGAL